LYISCIVSKWRMIVNDGLRRMYKISIVAYFEKLSNNLSMN